MKKIVLLLCVCCLTVASVSGQCHFGRKTKYSSLLSFDADKLEGIKFYNYIPGLLKTLNFHSSYSNTGKKAMMAIYKDDNGKPGDLIAWTPNEATLSSVQNTSFEVYPVDTIVEEGYYWIMGIFESETNIDAYNWSYGEDTVYSYDMPYGNAIPGNGVGFSPTTLTRIRYWATVDAYPVTSSITEYACVSYVSPSGTYTWDSSGTYIDTIAASSSCRDSIMTINLIISDEHSASSISVESCESYTSPSGNYIWSTSGLHNDTIINSVTCDSVITVDLLIKKTDTSIAITNNTLTVGEENAVYQWYSCNSSMPISWKHPNGTEQSHSLGYNGNYSVVVTKDGCSDTSACIEITNLDVFENTLQSTMNLFTDPITGRVNVDLGQTEEGIEVSVRNIFGQSVLVRQFNRTDRLSFNIDAPSGVYLVSVTTQDGKNATLKAIKR